MKSKIFNAKSRLALSVFFFLATVSILLIFELKTSITNSDLLWCFLFINFSLFLVLFKNKNLGKVSTFFKISTLGLMIVILFHFLLNIVDVYNIQRFSFFAIICNDYPGICYTVSDWFYKVKIYRFITLSPLFFSSLFVFLMYCWGVSALNFKKIKEKLSKKQSFILGLIIFYMIPQLVMDVGTIYYSVLKGFKLLKLPYEERFVDAAGGNRSHGWIKTLSELAVSQTSSDDLIVIPPDSSPWEMEGNSLYIRSFLYPRRVENIHPDNSFSPEAKAILITQGIYYGGDHSWPDFPISQERIEKIVLIDRETLMLTTYTEIAFIPEVYKSKWGVIILKHD